jgi:[FeFe] hydrogenase H-cluster maturation GTPase HydF
MILPQQMAIRDVLDNDAICMLVKETELEKFFELNLKPKLVITDSQVFDFVSKIVPEDVDLTSFSILFSRVKSDFYTFVKGVRHISNLKDGDNVLVLESCTHQVSCEDIGRFKIPNWLQKFTNAKLNFDFVSGNNSIPQNIENYQFVLQCGGCVSTKKQIGNRIINVVSSNVPITNYGMAIAYVNGIFDRAVEPLIRDYE